MKLMQITSIVITLIQMKVLHGKVIECGRRLINHEALITHGEESNEGSWPWHAAIYHIEYYQNSAYKCGGTLLTRNIILTAAHCVVEHNRPITPERILVKLGKYNLKVSGPNSQEFEAHQVIPHANYSRYDFSNDIAIIRLSTQAIFNKYVQPICMWDSNKIALSEITDRFGTVIGWGLTENDHMQHANILRQAVMPVTTFTNCLGSNRAFFGQFLSDKNFCAGFRNGTSVCKGDSGGSISFVENGLYRIRGIVSITEAKGDMCNSEEYVIFTDVAKYLPWIEKLVPELKQSSLKLGDQCLINFDKGVCTAMSQCSSIVNDMKQGKRDHVVCGQEKNEQIVCCPIRQVNTTKTPRISAKKCEEYKDFVYNNIYSSNINGTTEQREESSCAFTPFDSIVGIAKANKREFPHVALIGYDADNPGEIEWKCHGTLISDRFVLSAGRCWVVFENDDPKYVRLGDQNLGITDDASHIDINIIETIIHPEYRKFTFYNDIALSKLERKIQFTNAIRPACLPEVEEITTEMTVATVWPRPENRGRGNRGDGLLKVALNVLSNAECNAKYKVPQRLNRGIIDSQLCAGSYAENIGFCGSSVGGPLQILHQTYFCIYKVVGIDIFGTSSSCRQMGVNNGYTRVSSYLDWIESIVWPNDKSVSVSEVNVLPRIMRDDRGDDRDDDSIIVFSDE